MVNRGEEKVRVHTCINVVPRSTMNTNGGTEVPRFPLLGLTSSGLFMGSISSLI